jgi:hypothetical protein
MRKIDLSKTNGTMKKHLEKALAYQHYKKAMVDSFTENFDILKEAGINNLRKSFLETGKGCKLISAEEYADLAVETFNEVTKTRRDGPI